MITNKIELKKYLTCISKEEGLNYLKQWLLERKLEKHLDFAPMEFECKSLCFPSIKFFNKYYGKDSYKNLCLDIGLQFKCDYNSTPKFNDNGELDYICDSREQNLLRMPNIQITKLDFGDYTVQGSNLFIERKSLSDAVGTLSGGYKRFQKELDRCKEHGSYIIILIEEKYSNVKSFSYLPHLKFSRASETFIFHRIRELIHKYPLNMQFLAVDGRKEAVRVIEKIFRIEDNILSLDLQYLYNEDVL